MKTAFNAALVLALMLAGSSLPAQQPAEQEQQAKPAKAEAHQDPADAGATGETAPGSGEVKLFDGESLQGWSGAEGLWTVEDGAITGQTTSENPLEANSFLVCEQAVPDNCELVLKFRIEAGNSGVQFRSEQFQPHRVKGYQADIDSQMTYMGILYEEGGRGILCQRGESRTIDESGGRSEAESTGLDEKAFVEGFQPGEWHEYRITFDGNTIRQQIDGVTTAALVDQEASRAAKSGILALQLHVGPPMKVQFKDITVRDLGSKEAAGK